MSSDKSFADLAKTGIWGLDNILSGGFSRGHMFLVEGEPGTGKTTVALQFLMEGAVAGEKCLYITLSETESELRSGADSHGWTLGDNITVFELLPPESLLNSEQQQSLLYSSDLELGETTKQIFEAVERVQPSRVVLDSLSEIRLLAQSSLRYRRQILAIKHYFAQFNTTVMMLDDLTAELADKTVHSVAHGVIRIEELAPDYGAERRRVRVIKYRGVKFRGGYHDCHDIDRRSERFSAAGRFRTPHSIRSRPADERNCSNSISCWAAASKRGRARWCSDPPAPESRCWRSCTPLRR